VSVENSNVELGGPLDDILPLLGGHAVRDLGSVPSVVHQEKLQIVDVENAEAIETVGQEVLGFFVRALADLGHPRVTFVSPSARVIYAFGLAPARLDAIEAVRVETLGLLGVFFHDFGPTKRLRHLCERRKEKLYSE